MRSSCFFLLTILFSHISYSQTKDALLKYPEVGKPCPNFVLRNIQYFPKKQATLRDFRGKWLLLDFWSMNCGVCIAAFPHINKIQEELGDKVQVMMVGIQDAGRRTELIYARHRSKEHLRMPCAFDSAIAKKFDYSITPRTVLIDDKGIVRCLTPLIHLDEMKIFLAGGHPELPKSYRMNEDIPMEEHKSDIIPYDYEKLFAINNNGVVDTDFLYRSMLTNWQPSINRILNGEPLGAALFYTPRSLRIMGADVSTLYFNAYIGEGPLSEKNYGHYYNKLILDIPDSSIFGYDYKTGKNVFCYSVDLPRIPVIVTRAYMDSIGRQIMKIMQHDLENYFGLIAKVETKMLPCWSLVCAQDRCKKINSKGARREEKMLYGIYYKGVNVPFEKVFNLIKLLAGKEIIFDETNIKGNVDIDLDCEDCLLSNMNDLKLALWKNGLDLIRSEKKLKVLVVRKEN